MSPSTLVVIHVLKDSLVPSTRSPELSLDIDRNYGNKRVLTDFPLVNDGLKWTGTINKLIVGFDYTITGHAFKCTDCPEKSTIPVFDNYTVTTLAGSGSEGSTNGQGTVARFKKPTGVAVDFSGNVYVADGYNHLIRKLTGSNSSSSSNYDNNTYQEIFRGDTQHTVTEGTNSQNLRLSPLLDDRELTIPRITRINRQFQMVASTSVMSSL